MLRSPFLLLTAITVLASACGGNYSNLPLEDAAFLGALPQREQLEAHVPGTTGQPLTGDTGQVRQGLALGDPADLFNSTREGARVFNAGLDAWLQLLDLIVKLPPTVREPDRRVWGPSAAQDNPGFDVRLVVERAGNQFTYRLEYQKRPTTDAGWFPYLRGHFEPTLAIRKGQGGVTVDFDGARQKGLQVSVDPELSLLDITYRTDGPPTKVDMTFHAIPNGSYQDATYAYRELAGGVGSIRFTVVKDIILFTSNPETLEIFSRWLADGSGRADMKILAGDGKGAVETECWNPSASLTYVEQSWASLRLPPTGQPCVDVSALDGL